MLTAPRFIPPLRGALSAARQDGMLCALRRRGEDTKLPFSDLFLHHYTFLHHTLTQHE